MPTVGLKTLTLASVAPGAGRQATTAEGREIQTKIGLGLALIRLLADDNDPRAPEVAARLGEQVAELKARLEEIEKGGNDGGR